jgi:hypothetical protein
MTVIRHNHDDLPEQRRRALVCERKFRGPLLVLERCTERVHVSLNNPWCAASERRQSFAKRRAGATKISTSKWTRVRFRMPNQPRTARFSVASSRFPPGLNRFVGRHTSVAVTSQSANRTSCFGGREIIIPESK